jgi:hypothetical protein
MSAIPAFALSLLMLAAFALAIGGIWFIAKAKDRKRGVLMLAASAVFFVNVLIWTLPA